MNIDPRWKIGILALGAFGVAAALAFYVAPSWEEKSLFDDLRAEAETLSQAIQTNAATLLQEERENPEYLQILAETYGGFEGVLWVEIFDENAHIIAHTIRARVGEHPQENHEAQVKRVLDGSPAIEEMDGGLARYDYFFPVEVHRANGARRVAAVIEIAMEWKQSVAPPATSAHLLARAMAVSVENRITDAQVQRARLQELVGHFDKLPNVREVEVFDADQKVIAHSDPQRVGAAPLDADASRVRHVLKAGESAADLDPETTRFSRFVPIRDLESDGGTVLGVAKLVIDAGPRQAAMAAAHRKMLVLLLLFGAACGLVLCAALSKLDLLPSKRWRDQGRIPGDPSSAAGTRRVSGRGWLFVFSAGLATAVFALDLMLPLGVAASVPYVLVILVSLSSPKRSDTLLAAFAVTLLTILGYVFSPGAGVLWIVVLNRVLALFAIWVTTMLTLQRKRSEDALHENNWLLDATLENEKRTAAHLEATLQELETTRVAAETANRSKSEFLANMSHEIRTPMTAILGFADILLEAGDLTKAPPERIEAAKTIKRNGEYLLGIVNDILDLSKIEAGKMTVERISVHPCEILAQVGELARVRVDAKGLWFDIGYEGPIPETIHTDPTRLRQILINLVGNAIKFTEVGGVRLIARLGERTNGEPRMEFDVADTGIGMTQGQAAGLFRAFTQADTSTTRKFGGTGLGLSISRRLTELLGGEIRIVRTLPNVGTLLRISVATGPLDGVPMLDDPLAATVVRSDAPTGSDSQRQGDLGGLRILLAEDGPDNQRLIAHYLRKAGADVALAENGKLAVEAALAARETHQTFDLILMDMQMPEMDGYEATRALRQRGYTGPIIALTAHAMAGDRQKCVSAGCNDYLTKPIDRKTLLRLVAQHIRRAPTPQTVE